MNTPILLERAGLLGIVKLNAPEKRNPLPYAPGGAFLQALHALSGDTSVRAIIVAAEGSSFCSGMDLTGLQLLQQATEAENLSDSRALKDFFEYVRTYPKPLVAAIQGPVVAGGVGLVLCCDLALAVKEAWFSLSELKIGFVPALVAVYLKRAITPRIAQEWLSSAKKIGAVEAFQRGLVHELIVKDDLIEQAKARSEHLASLSPQAFRQTKELFKAGLESGLQVELELAISLNAQARMNSDCKEGIRAFLEKRAPQFGA